MVNKIKIGLKVVGRIPSGLNVNLLSHWSSELWEISSDITHHDLLGNFDSSVGWYSDSALEKTLILPDDVDFMICILNVPLEENYYSRTISDNLICFSFFEITTFLNSHNIPLENIVLRMCYAYCLMYLSNGKRLGRDNSSGRYAHFDTRGCLFDMSWFVSEIIYSVNKPKLCSQCEAALQKEGLSHEILSTCNKEISRITKPLYFRISDAIKQHPVVALLVSLVAAFIINLSSSFVFEILKKC